MNIVDSCGWLEYFADGPNADFFAPAVENVSELLVPSISLYKVFGRVLQQRSEGDALQAVATMMQGEVIALDERVALDATRLSLELKMPMADSVILTTARLHGAVVWTQDSDFEGLEGVEYIEKKGYK
jgi:predicted nucleic acid-binding protein